MAMRLLKRLGLPHDAAHIITLGLDGRVIEHARGKTTMTVRYLQDLVPVMN